MLEHIFSYYRVIGSRKVNKKKTLIEYVLFVYCIYDDGGGINNSRGLVVCIV